MTKTPAATPAENGATTTALETNTQLEALRALAFNALNPADLMAQIETAALPYSSGEELTGGFVNIDTSDKEAWMTQHIGIALFILEWTHGLSNDNRPFVTAQVFAHDGKFLIHDSSGSGICKQLADITEKRQGTSLIPNAGLLVKNGVRSSGAYFYDERTKQAIPGRDLDKVPAEFRKSGSPIWYLDL